MILDVYRFAACSAGIRFILVPKDFVPRLANAVIPFLNGPTDEVPVNLDLVPSSAVVVATVQECTRFLIVLHQGGLNPRGDVVAEGLRGLSACKYVASLPTVVFTLHSKERGVYVFG